MYEVFAEKNIAFASGALTLQTASHQSVRTSPGEIPGVGPPAAEALPKPESQEVPARVLSAARGVARVSLHRHLKRVRLALFRLGINAPDAGASCEHDSCPVCGNISISRGTLVPVGTKRGSSRGKR